MATNLDVGKYKNILEGTSVAPSLNFMFVPSSQNKHAVAKCCAQLGRCLRADVSYFLCCTGKRDVPFPRATKEIGDVSTQATSSSLREVFNLVFAAFCDSRKTLEKMAQPSHPCVKPGLHNRQFFFLVFSFLSTRVSRPCSRPKTRLTARRYSMSIGCSLCYQCLFAKSVLRSHFCLLNEGW